MRIARSPASSSSAMRRRPLLPGNYKNKRRESAKDSFLFDLHSVFLGDAARWQIIGMNQLKSRGSVSDCETRGRALPSPLRSPVLGPNNQDQADTQFRF